jgi:hypothetical protein
MKQHVLIEALSDKGKIGRKRFYVNKKVLTSIGKLGDHYKMVA